MGIETSRLTHHRYGSLPGGTLDNAALGSEIIHKHICDNVIVALKTVYQSL